MTSQQQARAAVDRASLRADPIATRPGILDASSIALPRWALSRRKRFCDIVVALVLLPVVVLVVSAAGVVSMFVFRTWPLFFQQRRGLGERPFRTLKVRSLPKSFPEQQGKLGLDVSDQGRWSTMLRHSHVDELPQLFNVLIGSMSIVGPRPMIDEVLVFLEPEDRTVRALVRPGVTGAWQVSTAGARPLHECTELDEVYVRRATFSADMRILWWTALALSRRRKFGPETVFEALSD